MYIKTFVIVSTTNIPIVHPHGSIHATKCAPPMGQSHELTLLLTDRQVEWTSRHM